MGDCYVYNFLRNVVVAIHDPACVQHILRDNFDNYEKSDKVKSVFFDLLGNGIFNTDGPVWNFHRKVRACVSVGMSRVCCPVHCLQLAEVKHVAVYS